MRLFSLVVLVGCAGKGLDDTGLQGIGTMTDPSGDSATISGTAYGFDSASNGRVALFYPGNANASCGDVARSLSGDADLDPTVITPSGTCSVFLLADYAAPGPTTFDAMPASLVLNCAFGDGSWTQSSDCDSGYCYTGDFWTGAPVSWSVTVSGGDESDYTWDATLSGGEGQFPYESLDAVSLTGEVTGTGSAGWCPEIGLSSYF